MTDKVAIDNLKSYIEELIEDYGYHKDIVEFRDSIEHLENEIKKKNERITELEKIEKAHRELNGELRKDVEMLEKSVCEHDEIIARLEEENTKLTDRLAYRIKYTNELEKDLFENCSNYVIPKAKIKEKIEKLEKEYKMIEQTSDFIIADTIQPKIEVLQELLEGKDGSKRI